MPAWTCLIRPFFDRLDFTVPWLFYPANPSMVAGPDTVFFDPFWEDRDHYAPPGVGVVPNSVRPYFGVVPPAKLGPVVGTADQWVNGVSFADLAGGLLPNYPCWQLGPSIPAVRARQKQRLTALPLVPTRPWQRQSIQGHVLMTCNVCPAGVPAAYTMVAAGFGAACVALNGTWLLQPRPLANCTWDDGAMPPTWTLTTTASTATLTGTVAGLVVAVYTAARWDCLADSGTFLKVSSCLPSDPPTLTVTARC